MRNQVFWTENLEPLRKFTDFQLLDLGELLSGQYDSFRESIFVDSHAAVCNIIERSIPGPGVGVIFTNLGILLEPDLKLNAAKVFLDFAVSRTVVLHWPYKIKNNRILYWIDEKSPFCFHFDENILQPWEAI